jgi:dTDP-4-dehydrorhamnose 3,5-epimerase
MKGGSAVPFRFERCKIPDAFCIAPETYKDDRGTFGEVYHREHFAANGLPGHFPQANRSRSRKGTLRGLHYQKNPAAQGKLTTVISGKIFDVAVDLRRSSPTYGQWIGRYLDAEHSGMLYVPEGCAHGFCVVSAFAEVLYFCTATYRPDLEGGIRWDDPRLDIPWPVKDPRVSSKDQNLPFFEQDQSGFIFNER